MADILDIYSTALPSHQVALDIFKGEWTSRFPAPWEHLQAGSTPLFEDPRAKWAVTQLGGVQDWDILELGPLEGGHSYYLERQGARSILSIEANTRAYLRCLLVKEILGLHASHFQCGDFRQYLKSTHRKFDLVFASGVLYHMTDPMRLLADMARASSRIYLWTHYVELDIVRKHELLRKRIGPAQNLELEGFRYQVHRYNYEDALGWSGFCGGTAAHCAWLTRESILGALAHFGFDKIDISFEDPNHPNGPCFSIVAQRAG